MSCEDTARVTLTQQFRPLPRVNPSAVIYFGLTELLHAMTNTSWHYLNSAHIFLFSVYSMKRASGPT